MPWERAKAFDGSALFSEFIEASESNSQFSFELKVNGELRQMGDVSRMIHAPHDVLAEIQGFMTLNDGDKVIVTKTWVAK